MAPRSWRETDFVALGVNAIAAIVLAGGTLGAIAGASSMHATALPETPDVAGPQHPDTRPPDDCGKTCADEEDAGDETDRRDRRGTKRGRT
ncbi:MAG TPA: hypothetical protein VI818_04805 [Candidatus Thermoplasmatota archaeon]|nr:hypothetical protein [Candidatus Thermoplasmatota archaeon]